MERVDLKLGFSCNNRCLFCVQGDKRERHGARDVGLIRRDLEEGLRAGATALVLTGGEPTLQPHLLETLRLGRELGYSRIQIQTNGRRFAYLGFCREVIRAGASEFSPALHASTPEVHDSLTRAPGSFAQTVAGITNLKSLGQTVITNTVLTTRNYRDAPDLARLLVSLGVDQFQFAFVHILGTAAENSAWLVPRKTDVLPYVQAGLDVGRAAGVRCLTEAIPYCLMRGYEQCVAERIIPHMRVVDAEATLEDYTRYRRDEGKQKGPGCPGCLHFEACEGPWREYPELFGWEEFVPVTAGDEPAGINR